MNPTQVALYARVSSEPQAETHTIASPVAALRERVAADGLTVAAAMQFLDEGYSGATLRAHLVAPHLTVVTNTSA
jgi:site-specific DNA recombinase